MPTQVDQICQDNEHYTSMNENYRSYCQELADFFLPRKAWINSIRIQGERVKFNFLYDSTGILSSRTTAHGIHSNLTNESMRWCEYEAVDEELMKKRENRMWFKSITDKGLSILRGTNFYNVQQEDWHGKIIFGTGTYSMLNDSRDFVKFKNIPVGDVNRVVDDNGRLIEIYVNFKLTARQAYKIFGERLSAEVLKAVVEKPYTEFEFLHFVTERYDRDPRYSDNLNMPFKSCWIEKKKKHLILESGFHEMPYISDVFYRDNNDPNGFSPAMDVLPWVKLLNAIARTVIRAGMKQTDPPLLLPNKGMILPLNFNPAGMNYRDAKTPSDAIQALPTVNGRVEVGVELMKYVEERVKSGMFVNLFQTFDDTTKQLRVLEADLIKKQSMAVLGPVIGRFDYGTLSPMLVNLYSKMNREEVIPPPPPDLVGAGFKIAYLGPLAKAQKQSELTDVQTFLAEAQAIGTVLPRALHKIDEDATIEYLHRTRRITPEILRSDEDLERYRKHLAEQEQIMASLQMAQAGGMAAKTAAEAQAIEKGQ